MAARMSLVEWPWLEQLLLRGAANFNGLHSGLNMSNQAFGKVHATTSTPAVPIAMAAFERANELAVDRLMKE